ncbi:MAG: LuxR C-terminal-related transcriptional regulator [Chloroflexi bacterium]|nr:LuxR C-terminal-related transcriptional regulator [Chloroflexota bacterium]MCI0575379.1 LuxR C-terminal-related transcriptional regulator [Chloroflexota bacterium]MCI0646373.1 LuxR C-terminal-related transcriptional regulator [Chloroflexota bacterium]MCI0728369.1 LuxR C-terminal-related transcriptional regulator [Chloroflexota bacterium]
MSEELYELLTSRELQVLSLLAEGLTDAEIAGALVLTVGTVKWYNRQIFGKLDVSNRTGAVARGRELGLLPSIPFYDWSQASVLRKNLPVPATPFVGRKQELADISKLFAERSHRLLTLIGPGGIGKSRLALEAASRAQKAFHHGVAFVPLAALESPDHIAATIAERLGFRFSNPEEPKQQLLGYLGNKEILLVLDNFEHLLDGAELLTELLQGAPGVKLLVTSRERLNLQNEVLVVVHEMDFPDWDQNGHALPAARLEAYSAAQLFVQHARHVRPELQPGEEETGQILRICQLLEGMPLAIVLAAGWLELLSLAEIAEEIAKGLDFLEGELQDLPPRQRSVRASFDYSWSRLPEAEQHQFMKLAVFRGGFTRPAAQDVAGASLPVLRKLADKSFFTMAREGRYEMHELLRRYGMDKLKAAGSSETARDAHSAYFLKWLQAQEAGLKGQRQLEALAEIEADLENVRAAWRWAAQRGDVEGINRAVEVLFLFFKMRGRFQEGVELLRLAQDKLARLEGEEPGPVWGRISTRLAILQKFLIAPAEEVKRNVEGGMALARQQGDEAEIAFSLFALAAYHDLTGDVASGLKASQESFERFRALNDLFYMARALYMVSYLGYFQGLDIMKLRGECLELTRQAGSKVDECGILTLLGFGAQHTGDYAAAEQYWHQAVGIASEAGALSILTSSKAGLALAHFLKGEMDKARQLAEEGLAIADIPPSNTQARAALSLVAGIAGNYVLSQALGQESEVSSSKAPAIFYSGWPLALAHCGSGNYDLAWHHLYAAAQVVRTRGTWTWLLPIAAVLLAHEGQKERAVEILGLVENHPLSARGWMEKWPLLAECRARLQAELGAERYAALWERGGRMDLATEAKALFEDIPPPRRY